MRVFRRNNGRPGAKEGPSCIRENLRNLAVHFSSLEMILDLGDVICDNEDLESSQEELAQIISTLRRLSKIPIVLGGGHETAWGHFLGLKKDLLSSKLGIINFDAHFDLRTADATHPASSGTPFFQAASLCQSINQDFNYAAVGIEEFSNTKYLFDKAKELKTLVIKRKEFDFTQGLSIKKRLLEFLEKQEKIYLSICLDVFSSSYAPGVSAPNPFGLNPREFVPLLKLIIESKKVIAFDLVELSPCYDESGKSQKLSALLVNEALHFLSLNG